MNWADALDVNFGGTHYTDWRLPSAVAGPYVFGYDGTTTAGYNITSSEMGRLFYTELGNKGYCDTSGNCPQTGWGLTNTGDFQNLQATDYWSGTKCADYMDYAWNFTFGSGFQFIYWKDVGLYALAVRPGDVSASVPEPSTLLLLGSGLIGIGIYRKGLKI